MEYIQFVRILTLCSHFAVNEYRIARVAEVLSDFRDLQHCIASGNVSAPSQTDHFTPAWTLLRQCVAEGQFILECSADISYPVGVNEHEQKKLELQQYVITSQLLSLLSPGDLY